MNKYQKKLNEEQKNKIIEMYNNNYSLNEIARIIGFSSSSISKFLIKKCIKRENKNIEKIRNTLSIEQEVQLCNDYQNFVSKPKLKQKYNIGRRKLKKILDKYNIKSNKNSDYPNPMKGKHFYREWIKKFGEEKAKEMYKPILEKIRLNSSGKNNPMYGKPSPNGAGHGWKGYYKDFYFRSLRELSYVIFLDKNNIKWETAEKKKFAIKYKNYDGTDRTYRPDFLVNDEKLVEIKPKRLQKSPLIKLKTEAAIKFCEENNLKFEIIDFPIDLDNIKLFLNLGLIKFSKNYEQKFIDYVKF